MLFIIKALLLYPRGWGSSTRPLASSSQQGYNSTLLIRYPECNGRIFMGRVAIFAILTWVCIPGLALAAAGAAPAPRLELKPCATLPGLPPEARCGTYEVWENRAARSGRKIPLRVVVIPAQGPGRLPDPFIYFDGG